MRFLITLPLLFAVTLTACSPANEPEKNTNTTSQPDAIETLVVINKDFPYAFEKVANNTWVMHGPEELPNPENKGFMNNPGLIVTSAGLVVIDPGSTVHVGKHVLTEIKKISSQQIFAVFNTHVHGDHWLANQAIKDMYPDVKIYGHPEMIQEVIDGEGEYWVTSMEALTGGASKGTIVVAPNQPINNTETITVGDTNFKIHHYGVAHTQSDIMIEVIENSVVFLGDNVLSRRMPRMSDGTFQGNISTVKKILETNAKVYVPGHGPTSDSSMVNKYINYLKLIYKAAQETFEEDLDSSDVIKTTTKTTAEYKDWYGYSDLVGPHGAQAYGEVEAEEF